MFPVYGGTAEAATAQPHEPAVVMYEPELDEAVHTIPEPEQRGSYVGAIQHAHNKIQELAGILPTPSNGQLAAAVEAAPPVIDEDLVPSSSDDFDNFAQKIGISDGYTAQEISDDEILADVEKTYSTAQAAAFFPSKKKKADGSKKDMSNQWMYWGLKNNLFVDLDNKPIEPLMVGKRRRFTLEQIEQIALSWHRRGNLSLDELKIVLRRVLIARHGMESFDKVDSSGAPLSK